MSARMVMLAYAAVADANDVVAIREVEQITHDRCLAATGDRRRSGVRWRHFPATDTATIDRLLSGHPCDVDACLSCEECAAAGGLRQFLADNPGGLLVIADCEHA